MLAELAPNAYVQTAEDGTSVAALVDFDNAFPDADISQEWVAVKMAVVIDKVLEAIPDATEIDIRLYGGWMADGVLTNSASKLDAAIGAGSLFPRMHPAMDGRVLRGDVQLVTRLVDEPSIIWEHTLKERRGLPRSRLSSTPYPQGCASEDSACGARLINKMARSQSRQCSVEDCTVTNREAFTSQEQKMVDVLIACDGIALAEKGWSVAFFSGDADLVPAVALAVGRASARIVVVRDERHATREYEEALRQRGVTIVDFQRGKG